MRGTKPPDDFDLIIYPKYVLKYRKNVRVELTPNMGELLSIFMGSRGVNLSLGEVEGVLYAHERMNEPEWQREALYVLIHLLRKRLLTQGFMLNIDPEPGRRGYKFTGFDVIDPKPSPAKKLRRTPRRAKAEMMPLNGKLPIPAPPKVLPPAYAAAQQAPWHFPPRLEFSREK